MGEPISCASVPVTRRNYIAKYIMVALIYDTMLIAIILVVVLILLWYCGYLNVLGLREGYRSCRECDGRMSKDTTLVINPFIWPYSGSNCIGDLYVMNRDNGTDFGFNAGPLTHLSTPDHVELIN